MGLFRKSRKSDPPVPASPPAPVISPADVTTAHRVTVDFLAALGDDQQTRRAAYAISRAGGGPADVEAALRGALHGDAGLSRPWRWLAEVADHSSAAGDPQIVASIAAVVMIWHREMRGRLGIADVNDMMLEPPPPELVTRICSTAVRRLADADPGMTAGQSPVGTITVGGTLWLCCQEVLGADPPAAAEVRQIAERVISAA